LLYTPLNCFSQYTVTDSEFLRELFISSSRLRGTCCCLCARRRAESRLIRRICGPRNVFDDIAQFGWFLDFFSVCFDDDVALNSSGYTAGAVRSHARPASASALAPDFTSLQRKLPVWLGKWGIFQAAFRLTHIRKPCIRSIQFPAPEQNGRASSCKGTRGTPRRPSNM